MRTLLFDGDILAFMASARAEVKIDWEGDGETSRVVNIPEVINSLTAWVNEMVNELSADRYIIAMSDPTRHYFRHDVFPAYKSNRNSGLSPKPLALDALKDHVRNNMTNKWKPGLEADDVLGILATHKTALPGEKVIVTSDKDLLQIAGLHYNPRKDKEGVITKTVEEAEYFFLQQALSGDPTDGVPGCPGIGPVKAKKVLDAATLSVDSDDCADVEDYFKQVRKARWEAIESTYVSKGRTVEEALQMARCVRILQARDYNYATSKVVLWTPVL